MENSMEVPKKKKIELPYSPVIPLLGIYPKEMKTLTWKYICTPTFIAALFPIAKKWKQLKCPSMDEGIKETWYINTFQVARWYRIHLSVQVWDPWDRKILWRGKWQPTPVFLPGKSRGQRSLAATVHGVTKSRTRLSTARKQCAYIPQWKIVYPYERGNPATFDNIDGPWGHDARWNVGER